MLGLIMLLAMVFDVSEKLSEFISNRAPLSAIILEYYLPFLLFHGNMFSSMIIFISVIWFTAKMAQDTEIIPMWFSGKPITRFIRPYMIAATALMALSLLLNHLIVPASNKLRLGFEEKYYRDILTVENYHADFPGNQSVYFSNYTDEKGRVTNFVIQQWSDKTEPIRFIKAAEAYNVPHTHRWKLKDGYIKTQAFPKGKITYFTSKDTTFAFSIDEMAQRENVAETMTYWELHDMIEREKIKGSSQVPFYEIEMYQRTSYPFATYILTMIGVSVASRKKRGGIGLNIAIGLGFVFIYIFTMKVMTVASLNVGFPAILAVWVPNIIFGVVALVLFKYAQK